MDIEPQFLLFGLHSSLWSVYQLETAIKELIRDHYVIDPVRSSDTRPTLIMRLERLQRTLTQEEVSSITEIFQDRGYAPRRRVTRAGRAAGEVAARVATPNAVVEVCGDMERIDPNIGDGESAVPTSAGVASAGDVINSQADIEMGSVTEEGSNVQQQQPPPIPRNAGSCVIGHEDHVSPAHICLECYGRGIEAQGQDLLRATMQVATLGVQINELRDQNLELERINTNQSHTSDEQLRESQQQCQELQRLLQESTAARETLRGRNDELQTCNEQLEATGGSQRAELDKVHTANTQLQEILETERKKIHGLQGTIRRQGAQIDASQGRVVELENAQEYDDRVKQSVRRILNGRESDSDKVAILLLLDQDWRTEEHRRTGT